jgi:hypothetical protein
MIIYATVFLKESADEVTAERIKLALEYAGILDAEVHIFTASDEPNKTRPRWADFPPPEHTGEF